MKDCLNKKAEQFKRLTEYINGFPGLTYIMNKDGVFLGQSTFNDYEINKFKIPECVVGKTLYDLVSNKIAENYYMDFAHEVMGLDKELVRYKAYSATGKEYNDLLYNKPLKDSKGKIIGIVGNVVDINYIKQTTKQLFSNVNNNLNNSNLTEDLFYLQNHLNIALKNLLVFVNNLELNAINNKPNNITLITDTQKYLKDLLNNFPRNGV